MFDTGDFYGMGDNELLLADALVGRPRDQVQLSVKFGVRRAPDGSVLGMDPRTEPVRPGLGETYGQK